MTTTQRTTRALAIAVQAGGSVLLWGPPGVGKTATVHALADALGWHHEVVIGSIRDATDIGGLPVREGSGVVLAPPAWVRRIEDAAARGVRSLLFLDELTTAPPPVQAAMLRVVLERVVGDVPLPAGTAVVAAANPPEVAADGYDLAPPLANRFCHLDWPVDPASWCDGFLAGWPDPHVPDLPGTWRSGVPAWRARVAGFLRHRPALLHAVPQALDARGRAWPSPRSWEAAAGLLAAADAADPTGEAAVDLLAGSVGEGPAVELLAWVADADLPDPEDVLRDPAVLDLPQRGDRLLAALGAVAGAVAARPSEERWEQAWAVLAAVTAHGQSDVGAVAARALLAVRRSEWLLPAAVEAFVPVLSASGALDAAVPAGSR